MYFVLLYARGIENASKYLFFSTAVGYDGRSFKKKQYPRKSGDIARYDCVSFFIRTLPSVWESHPFGTFVFADYTAGMEFHQSPKILRSNTEIRP